MNRALKQALSAIIALGLAGAASGLPSDDRGNLRYRYVNEHGIKVIAAQVPPRFVGKGYEVLSPSGQVLEVVPPELTGEELEAQRRRIEQEKADRELRRRYSSEKDIDDARRRKLATVQQDMAIMRSNIMNLRSEVRKEEATAARLQRNNRPVSAEVSQRIQVLEGEIALIQTRLDKRTREAEAINERYQGYMKRFREISARR